MITALLGDVGRKNCWTLAEAAGEEHPWGMQHLLGRAVWDTDAVAAELRSFVGEHLGAPDGVLIVDETGDAKKGRSTVGVQRQYSGTTGRIENPPQAGGAPSQVAVHLAYASGRGHALVDRELGVPPARSVGETCPGRGRTTLSGALRPGCQPKSPSRPSRRWPRR